MIANLRKFAENILRTGQRQDNQQPTQEEIKRRARQQVVQAIENRLAEKRSSGEKFSDGIVSVFGTLTSAVIHLIIFAAWLTVNLGVVSDVKVFDPYPFTLLTMAVSLEAIFLAIFVLISQNRESNVSKLREEIDIQINMIAEQEITKVIHLLSYLMKHLNVPTEDDPELQRMMKPLDTDEMRRELERQLNFKDIR